jgi:hypothetical protein
MTFLRFLTAIGIVVGCNLSYGSARSQPVPSQLQFNPPPSAANSQQANDNEGRPPNRVSGGSRGGCLHQFMALVPSQKAVVDRDRDCPTQFDSSLALTLSATPSFWFYIPAKSHSRLVGEFVLFEGDKAIYKQVIPLSQTPGTISVRPNHVLEPNKQYRWIFAIALYPQNPAQNPAVRGLIQRIVPDTNLSSQLQAATSERDRIIIYAKNGIWHDALTELGELHRTNPKDNNLQADWSKLLSSIGLGAIAEIPLVNCCLSAQKQ